MTVQEKFTQIITKEKENQLMPFLQKLEASQKKELVPLVQKFDKEYCKYVSVGITGSWRQKGSKTQIEMIHLTAFVCMTRRDFEKVNYGITIIDSEACNQILSWYCPDWFNDYVHSIGEWEYLHRGLNYNALLAMQEKGYVHLSPELIVKFFPRLYIELFQNNTVYNLDNLYRNPLTLNEHVWYIFQFESNIHWENRFYFRGDDGKNRLSWTELLVQLSGEGILDRKRLLREILLATTRNFNKNLTGWFVNLFVALKPTAEELLYVQKELFASLNATHSKPVNIALKYLKKIALENKFELHNFLDNVFPIIAAETKSVVKSTLILLEKLVKKHKSHATQICNLASQAFMHHDDGLQISAAKMIAKYGNADDASLLQTLEQYGENMYANAKKLLHEFLPETSSESLLETIEDKAENLPILQGAIKIQSVEKFDDLVFLASQAFDNNQPYHFDLLPAALIKFDHLLNEKNINKLEPAFQRAYKLLMQEWRGKIGLLDHMLANFFMDYGQYLIRKFKVEANNIYLMHKSFKKLSSDRWSFYKNMLESLEEWRTIKNNPIYVPFKSFLLEALEMLKNGHQLPLLSTPTHEPSWIDPVVLVERLNLYQQKGVKPGEADLQLAISRTTLDDTNDAIAQTHKKLEGEFKNIMLFLLDKNSNPKTPIEQPALWMTAAITKAPATIYPELENYDWHKFSREYFSGQVNWKVTVENHSYTRYDYNRKKFVKVNDPKKELKLDKKHNSQPSVLNGLITKLLSSKDMPELFIYQNLDFKAEYLSAEPNDVQRYFSLLPHNQEPLLAQVIKMSLVHSTFWEEGNKKMVTAALETVLKSGGNYGIIAHLFIASCMLCSDKTARSIAAEIWVKGISENTINSQLLGNIIGDLESVEFAPLKRLTDLITSQMFMLSEKHNKALEEMLASCLDKMPEAPVRNLKKLLEIYREMLAANGKDVADTSIVQKAEKWKSSPSLTKVISSIEELQLA